ncbi:MAG: hypothetical protein J6Y77_00445 [Paludibacteraceae bacterium]|nr:hypothetical protein [Paludibacteraceae bacterium]
MKAILKTALIVVFGLVAALPAFAADGQKDQNQEQTREQRRKERAMAELKYLDSLQILTPEEYKKFAPVYLQYKVERQESRHIIRQNRRMIEADTLSEAETEEALKRIYEAEAESNRIDAKFNAKFIELIGATKTSQILEARDRYKKRMLVRIQQKKAAEKQKKSK